MEKLSCLIPMKCSCKGDFDSFGPLPRWNNVMTEHIREVKVNVWDNSAAVQMLAIQSV